MKDTIIKGSGNSRSLKTVPNALTLYPTHEAMVAAMVDGTFPIDLGPLSAAGVQERGMDLNKENLLKDATAALYGLSGDDTSPDDVLAAIAPILDTVDGKSKVVAGTYTGTGEGNSGVVYPQSIQIPFYPIAVLVGENGNFYVKVSTNVSHCGFSVRGVPYKVSNIVGLEIVESGFVVYTNMISSGGYASGPLLNNSSNVYYYIAIG